MSGIIPRNVGDKVLANLCQYPELYPNNSQPQLEVIYPRFGYVGPPR